MGILQSIDSVLREKCGLTPPAVIVAGISGGPDSLCLMHALHKLGYRVFASHLDHQLRPESAVDGKAVKVHAAALGIPFVMRRFDVAARARVEHLSIEEAGRKSRYEFLFEQARAHSADVVAVGHTADDQAETVLMHLIRGAGMAGLRGMGYRSIVPEFDKSIPLVRPLLDFRRPETESYCRENSLAPVYDRSNESSDFLRNRVRNELMPHLESYNPRIREALWRTAASIGSDFVIIEERIAELWRQNVAEQNEDFVCFHGRELLGLAPPLRRRLIMRAINELSPGADVGFEVLSEAATFVAGEGSSRQHLGGSLLIEREPGAIYVRRGGKPLPQGDWPQLAQPPVLVPEVESFRVPLGNHWYFEARFAPVVGSALDLIPRDNSAYQICLDADTLPHGLQLRWPRSADRISPLGMRGHFQKLSDIFVNQKVPARARERWPVLASNGTVIWIAGFPPAEDYRLQNETRRAAFFAVSRSISS